MMETVNQKFCCPNHFGERKPIYRNRSNYYLETIFMDEIIFYSNLLTSDINSPLVTQIDWNACSSNVRIEFLFRVPALDVLTVNILLEMNYFGNSGAST
jgi:hypothetical protein